MAKVFTEITRLSDKDCFYIVERHKTEFTYPLHQHKEYELNFIEHGKGVRRIVGDNVEEIGDYELVLLGGEGLEHVWEQGNCKSKDIREITIQFSEDIFGDGLLSKNQFASIKQMLYRARHGLSFSLNSIMKVYATLDNISKEPERFVQFLKTLYVLYELSIADDAKALASGAFSHAEQSESGRIQKVKQYVSEHYHESLKLDVKTHPSPDTPLVDIIDAQHLLFAGDGFIISELYWEEEVLVPGGGGQPAEVVVWENDGSFPSCNWGGHYRFGLEGMDSLNECAATFPADVWERLKSAPFNILIEPVGDWFSIRVMDGWWSVGNDQSGARDLTPNTEGVVNNGDGTWVVPISLPEDLLPVLDAQHLLFSGGEYTILKIYYYE